MVAILSWPQCIKKATMHFIVTLKKRSLLNQVNQITGRYGSVFFVKNLIFKFLKQNNSLGTHSEIQLLSAEVNAIELHQWEVMIGSGNGLVLGQARSHYLNQCWPRSMSPYCVNRTQCVNFARGLTAGSVRPCAKLWPDWIIRIQIKVKAHFPEYWIMIS